MTNYYREYYLELHRIIIIIQGSRNYSESQSNVFVMGNVGEKKNVMMIWKKNYILPSWLSFLWIVQSSSPDNDKVEPAEVD